MDGWGLEAGSVGPDGPTRLGFFGTMEKRIGPGLGQWVLFDSRPGKFPPSNALTLSVVVRFSGAIAYSCMTEPKIVRRV